MKDEMSFENIMKQLEEYGNEQTKKIFKRHGAKEPIFGVKVQDLKKIQKKVKKNYQLSLQLYASGNSDAMYLAGLIADEEKMKKNDLNSWVKQAYWYMLSEYTVAWVASETKFGFELAKSWIDSAEETIASSGWATLTNYLSITEDKYLDILFFKKLLQRVEKEIDQSPNRVKYTMNGFVIAVGSYIMELHEDAIKTANKIGKIKVDMGGTSCKVPVATDYIKKVVSKGKLGNKRKQARC